MSIAISGFNQEITNQMNNAFTESFSEGSRKIFIESFKSYCNEDQDDVNTIDLDDAWQFMGFTRKDCAKRAIINNLIENVDYKIHKEDEGDTSSKLAPPACGAVLDDDSHRINHETSSKSSKTRDEDNTSSNFPYHAGQAKFSDNSNNINHETSSKSSKTRDEGDTSSKTAAGAGAAVFDDNGHKQNGGQNKQKLTMSISAFKKMCMISNTKKGKETRQYYIEFEAIIMKYIQKNTVHLIEQNDKNLIEACDNKKTFYILDIGNNLAKFGTSRNVKSRISEHRRTFDVQAIHCIYETADQFKAESTFRNHPEIKSRLTTYCGHVEILHTDSRFISKMKEIGKKSAKCQEERGVPLELVMEREKTKQSEIEVEREKEKTKQSEIEVEREKEKNKQTVELEKEKTKQTVELEKEKTKQTIEVEKEKTEQLRIQLEIAKLTFQSGKKSKNNSVTEAVNVPEEIKEKFKKFFEDNIEEKEEYTMTLGRIVRPFVHYLNDGKTKYDIKEHVEFMLKPYFSTKVRRYNLKLAIKIQ